jgi:hypothetical protein
VYTFRRRHATVARSTVFAARAESRFSRSSAAPSAPFAFSPVQLQLEEQYVPALPGVSQQQCRTGDQIFQRRGVCSRGLCALARKQIELGHLLALVSRGDQGRAAVELIDDVEDRLLPLLGRYLRRELSADSKVRLVAKRLGD